MLASIPKMLLAASTTFLTSSLMLINLNTSLIMEWEIIHMTSSSLNLNMIMEWSSMLYSSIVMFISSMVMNFSTDYMKSDKNKPRFWMLILLFVLSMNLLILIPNMMMLLIGWDGLGITSFILIIYYNNPQSMSAGMFTMVTNRLGDVFLLMAITANLNNSNWLPMLSLTHNQMMTQSMGIMIAAMTKSAQFPYSSWLPAAMAAPTPVSALVHSSTLVTAGIFLLYRFNNLIIYSNMLQSITMVSSLLTMLMAAMSAMYETDMKKIIALSTLSQLGLMMLTLSLKMFNLMFFHMVTHAMFKALLFICAGTMISSNSHNQDTRLYGKYTLISPIITSSFFVSGSAMIGMPFMAGYYSKHMILEWSSMKYINITIYTMLMISILLTSLYTLKLILSTMATPPLYKPLLTSNISKNSLYPTSMMSIMSISLAPMLQWSMSTTTLPQMAESHSSHTTNMLLMLSMMLTLLYSLIKPKKPYLMNKIFSSLSFLNPLSTKLITLPYLNMSLHLFKSMDQSWLEKMTSMSTLPVLMNTSLFLHNSLMPTAQKNLLSITILAAMPFILFLKM